MGRPRLLQAPEPRTPVSLRAGPAHHRDVGIRAGPDAQSCLRFDAPPECSCRHHEVERALFERGVLERTVHLVAPGRVPGPVVEVLGDRVERDPLASGAAVLSQGRCRRHVRRPRRPAVSPAERAPTARVDLDPLRAARVAAGLRRHRRLRSCAGVIFVASPRQPDPTTEPILPRESPVRATGHRGTDLSTAVHDKAPRLDVSLTGAL